MQNRSNIDGLKIDGLKIDGIKSLLRYLCQVINKKRIQQDPKKCAAVREWTEGHDKALKNPKSEEKSNIGFPDL